jgi:hypothetical protein
MRTLVAQPLTGLSPVGLLEQMSLDQAEELEKAVVRLPPAVGAVAGVPKAEIPVAFVPIPMGRLRGAVGEDLRARRK